MRSSALALAALAIAACTSATTSQRAPSTSSTQEATLAPPTPAPTIAPPFDPAPPGKRVALLWTASLQGYVEPCGCTGDPLGGVARLAAAVEAAQKAYGKDRVLFVDGGDMLFEHLNDTSPLDTCQQKAKNELLASTLTNAGVRATVRGPLDEVRGLEWRKPFLSGGVVADLVIRDGDTFIGSIHPARLGASIVHVIGVRADDATQLERAHSMLEREVSNVPASVQRPDAVVVLAQSPRDLTKKIVASIKGIDVVIQGRDPGEVPVPPEVLPDGAVLVAAGQQGQYLGVVEMNLEGRTNGKSPLTLDDTQAKNDARAKELKLRVHEIEKQIGDTPDGPRKQFLQAKLDSENKELASIADVAAPKDLAPASMRVRAIPLPRGFPEDPDVAAQLAAYQKSVPTLVAQCEANATCPAPKVGAPTFVGANACRACHASQYDFWSKQLVQLPGKDKTGRDITRTEGHVHAWQTLVVDAKDRDRDCVGCHSVGFGEPGGPCKTSDVVTMKLDGVQCESCHGPGSTHAKSGDKADIVGKPDEARCRSCHHVPHIPTTESFVFNDRLKLILGKGHGEKRRAELP